MADSAHFIHANVRLTGLYRGYKRRNAELDSLSDKLPAYLKSKKVSPAVLDFTDVDDESTLREVHDYIFKRYNLLDRVVRARKIHHSHFFAIDNDYGHEKYLDKLQNERYVMVKALEKLGKRATALMHEQEQWYDWVKKAHEEEEKHSETESKKVKLESLLFKRHLNEVTRYQREVKSREAKKQQEEFLEQAYIQRVSEMSEKEQDEWDPIQDVYGYERYQYVDLIKFFLMLEDRERLNNDSDMPELAKDVDHSTPAPDGKALSKSAKKRAKKANAETKKMDNPTTRTAEGRGSNVIEMETKQQMRERLAIPVKFERPDGMYIAGDGPTGIDATTPVLPDDEIEVLLSEVAEIKKFLFCRLLLSQPSLLSAALESDSIEEFFDKSEVTREHLRNLCLKLERPGLQDVRDACADFIRERDGVEEEEEEEEVGTEDDGDVKDHTDRMSSKHRSTTRLWKGPLDQYKTKRERAAKKDKKQSRKPQEPEVGGLLDFGKTTDESEYPRKRLRIKICGRYMYNYPSEKALNRGGWFHFSVIAKDSDYFDVVELCRNWNEFFELNILCLYNYFPAPKWSMFVGDIPRQQLLQLGFIPYFDGDKADKVTYHFQTGSRGMARRSHEIVEMRNFICGHIKRDDPVSRRFIQYLSNETWELRALVRDCKTGRILIQPPAEELWLLREKSGWGRAARNEFNIITEVGPAFFEQMDKLRKWRFDFVEYYDIYVWDADPGHVFHKLQRKLEEILARAWRVRVLKDMFSGTRHILQTITHDPETKRVRSIKPGEKVESMWDGLDRTAKAWTVCPAESPEAVEIPMLTYGYTEADELEDALLFPLEASGALVDNLFRDNPSAMDLFEKGTIDPHKFAEDLDTDDESMGSTEDTDYEEYTDSELDEEALAALSIEDRSSAWMKKEETLALSDDLVATHEEDTMQEAAVTLTDQLKHSGSQNPDYFLPILRNPANAKEIPTLANLGPADLMMAMRTALSSLREYDTSERAMRADFLRHLDREKSKVFKKSWHLADLEPGAPKRYQEANFMVMMMDNYTMSRLSPGPFELCKFMQLAKHIREERRIVKDAFLAHAAMALFFDTDAFLADIRGSWFRKSLLLKQEERAKHIPDRRTHMSNKTMPADFWKDWDKLKKDNKRNVRNALDDIYPIEWRKATRPVIIQLFRAGIICSSYGNSAAGHATANAEPNRPMDLYLDYRAAMPYHNIGSHLKDPTGLDRDFLIDKAKQFRAQHASAKFAALRLWSAPHFYPLMLGLDSRPECAFLDDRDRCWEFKFIPKDLAHSEWSIHYQLSLRLEPYKRMFREQAIVAKDLVLVMGQDEKNLRQLAEGVTWAVQTRPWRLEIDLWRSFVNVDVEFLEGLDRRWLD